jgi:protein TonB
MTRPDIRHFIVLSLALHAGVLMVNGATDLEMPRPAGPLRLELIPDMPVPPGQRKDRTESASSAGKTATGTSPVTTNLTGAAIPRPLTAAAAITATPAKRPDKGKTATTQPRRSSPASVTSRASLEAELRAQLRRALVPHFTYPLLARRRGWEGTVKVGVRIEADGTLTRLHLVETSHHAVLNQAAVESLRRIAQLPEAGTWLGGGHVDLVLPIEYRLMDTKKNG